MRKRDRQDKIKRSRVDLADRLHSAAIHLLRRLRRLDEGSGLTAPRLSALSVVVFAGPITMSDLASAEQVKPPTISRLVKDLESEGLVVRVRDREDERVQKVSATSRGRLILSEGRERRVRSLAADLDAISSQDRQALKTAVSILERMFLPSHHPGKSG